MKLRIASESVCVKLNQLWMLLQHILHKRIYLLTGLFDLAIEGVHLATLLLKLYKTILLVKYCKDPTLWYHFGYELLSFLGWDTKEVSKLIKGDVHVEFACAHDIVLDDCPLQDRVALLQHILEVFKGLFELLHVCIVDSFSFKHPGKQVIELIALKSLIIVQYSQKSRFLWPWRRKNGSLQGPS